MMTDYMKNETEKYLSADSTQDPSQGLGLRKFTEPSDKIGPPTKKRGPQRYFDRIDAMEDLDDEMKKDLKERAQKYAADRTMWAKAEFARLKKKGWKQRRIKRHLERKMGV